MNYATVSIVLDDLRDYPLVLPLVELRGWTTVVAQESRFFCGSVDSGWDTWVESIRAFGELTCYY